MAQNDVFLKLPPFVYCNKGNLILVNIRYKGSGIYVQYNRDLNKLNQIDVISS
jgi:hypothetical protein